MKNKNIKSRKSLKVIWILSYMAVLIVPLTACIIVYISSANTLQSQIKSQNLHTLENIRDGVNAQLIYNEKVSLELVADKKLNEISSYKAPLTKEERYNLYSFINTNSTFLNYMSENIGLFCIYFSEIDFIATNKAGYTAKTYYNAFMRGSSIDEDAWQKILSDNHRGEYINLSNKASADYIMYFKTLPLTFGKKNTVNVFCMIDADKIIDNVSRLYTPESGNFKIIADDGSIIIERGKKNEEKKTFTITCDSEVNRWKYYYSVPYKEVFASLASLKRMIILLVGLCVALGLYLVFYFSKKHYEPVYELVSLFANNNGEEFVADEYSYISKMIKKNLSETLKMATQIKNKEKYVISTALDKRMRGEKVYNDFEISALRGMKLESAEFYVINLFYYNTKNIFFGEDNNENDGNIEHFIITNIMDELLGKIDVKNFSTRNTNGIVYVVIRTQDKDEALWKNLRFLQKFVYENFNFDVGCAISQAKNGLKGIEDGYNEIIQIMRYISVNEEKGLWHFSDVPGNSLKYSYTFEQEQRLVMLLKNSDKENVLKMLEKLMDNNLKENKCSVDALRSFALALGTTAERTLYAAGKNTDEELDFMLRALRNHFNYSDIENIREKIYEIFDVVCEKMQQTAEKDAAFIKKIECYVNENYADINMNIAGIARHFSMQYDQLSKIFKEHTGIRLLDYLNTVRIERAKELLRTTDVMINDIPLMVGFSNYRTFVRVFTSVVGIGPKKYRDTERGV